MACRLAFSVDVHQALAGVSVLRCFSRAELVTQARPCSDAARAACSSASASTREKGGEWALCRWRLGANISGSRVHFHWSRP